MRSVNYQKNVTISLQNEPLSYIHTIILFSVYDLDVLFHESFIIKNGESGLGH